MTPSLHFFQRHRRMGIFTCAALLELQPRPWVLGSVRGTGVLFP